MIFTEIGRSSTGFQLYQKAFVFLWLYQTIIQAVSGGNNKDNERKSEWNWNWWRHCITRDCLFSINPNKKTTHLIESKYFGWCGKCLINCTIIYGMPKWHVNDTAALLKRSFWILYRYIDKALSMRRLLLLLLLYFVVFTIPLDSPRVRVIIVILLSLSFWLSPLFIYLTHFSYAILSHFVTHSKNHGWLPFLKNNTTDDWVTLDSNVFFVCFDELRHCIITVPLVH